MKWEIRKAKDKLGYTISICGMGVLFYSATQEQITKDKDIRILDKNEWGRNRFLSSKKHAALFLKKAHEIGQPDYHGFNVEPWIIRDFDISDDERFAYGAVYEHEDGKYAVVCYSLEELKTTIDRLIEKYITFRN